MRLGDYEEKYYNSVTPPKSRIYALVCGEDDEAIFYIGSTSKPLHHRLQAHIRDGKANVCECEDVRIIELIVVDELERYSVEGLAIRLALAYGYPLVNKVIPRDNL